MKTPIIAIVALSALIGCDRASTGPSATTAADLVFDGQDGYDSIAVRDGFVYVELPGAGVARCPVAGCAAPTPVVDSAAFVSSTTDGAKILYATQIASDDGASVIGSIRSVQGDGSADQSVQDGLVYPAYLAGSANRVFWARDSFAIDETPATVECIGCSGATSTPWFQLQGGTYGMLADDENVYVLADDPSKTSLTLLSCSASTPCFSEPKVILSGIAPTTSIQQIALDGKSAYVARATDIVRVDSSGATTTIVQAQGVTSIVVDRASGTLYYGTMKGDVGSVKSDGTTASLASTGTLIAGMDVDATSLYFLAGASTEAVFKISR